MYTDANARNKPKKKQVHKEGHEDSKQNREEKKDCARTSLSGEETDTNVGDRWAAQLDKNVKIRVKRLFTQVDDELKKPDKKNYSFISVHKEEYRVLQAWSQQMTKQEMTVRFQTEVDGIVAADKLTSTVDAQWAVFYPSKLSAQLDWDDIRKTLLLAFIERFQQVGWS
jgi:hypothetical protein